MSMVSFVECEVCGFSASAAEQAWGEYQHDGLSVCEDCQSVDCEECRECGHFDVAQYLTDGVCDYCEIVG